MLRAAEPGGEELFRERLEGEDRAARGGREHPRSILLADEHPRGALVGLEEHADDVGAAVLARLVLPLALDVLHPLQVVLCGEVRIDFLHHLRGASGCAEGCRFLFPSV